MEYEHTVSGWTYAKRYWTTDKWFIMILMLMLTGGLSSIFLVYYFFIKRFPDPEYHPEAYEA